MVQFLRKSYLAVIALSTLCSNVLAEDSTSSAVAISPYIVNGSNADVSDYPSFVSLFQDSSEYNFFYSVAPYCGGTLLNDQYVLTAAHCIYGNQESQLFTMAAPQLQNENDYLTAEKQRVVEIYHPANYSNDIGQLLPNDIAILKLESALSIGTAIAQPRDESYRSGNHVFTAVGHGNTQSNVDATSVLQKVNLSWVDNSVCAGEFDNGHYLESFHLCFTGDYSAVSHLLAGSCQGDSGGPIYWDDAGVQTQVGITSFGPVPCGDNTRNVTAVFTEIADYSDWINDVLNGQIDPDYVSTDEERTAYLISQGFDIRSNESTTSSSSGGGAISLFALLMLTFFGWKRERHVSAK
ncbi:S1 family peptidase [Vibrio methylphosphonaticus]|uniref:S1 family peptidase n=1 Tax=Vibrio methylphosphonaticus TaxID=2946866 RepID=UPI00202A33DE|nr:trypsin-like serine protease [Vibrio methylphosphonaticus]MCL9773732.1 trypsin-like serine protease [Vibrio methylphosphonaticus]